MDFFTFSGVFLSLIIALSIAFNGIVIITFLKHKRIVRGKDYYLFSLAVCSLLQALIGYPMEVNAMLRGAMQIEDDTCRILGFFVTFLGLSSINHLAFFAIDRTVIMKFPYYAERWNSVTSNIISFVVIWIYAFIWATLPLFGWSSYSVESDGVRCSIDWDDNTSSGQSYIYSLFLFEFVVPIFVMTTSFVIVRKVTVEMGKRHNEIVGDRNKAENFTKKHNNMILIMSLAFLIAWTPYTSVSMYGAVTGDFISAKASTIAAIAAKSSTVFNPVIYALIFNDFRQKCKRIFCKNCLANLPTIKPSSTIVSAV